MTKIQAKTIRYLILGYKSHALNIMQERDPERIKV